MGKTLDEWTEKCAKRLKDNLQVNLEQFQGEKITKETIESLMRLNLIMIRDWAQDWGVE